MISFTTKNDNKRRSDADRVHSQIATVDYGSDG